MTFRYTDEERAAIIEALPGPVSIGTGYASTDMVIARLEQLASVYIKHVAAMVTPKTIAKKVRALETVLTMLDEESDKPHHERLSRELEHWRFEAYLTEKPREKRARLHFMVDAFDIFARADEMTPCVDMIVFSDSEAGTRDFYNAAIAPVLVASGEKMEVRAAITAWNGFREKMRKAEIELMRAELQYAANGGKI